MKVHVVDHELYLSSIERSELKKQTELILKTLNLPDCAELCVSLVNDITMRKLNETYRGMKRTTDILSFPQMDMKLGYFTSAIAYQNNLLLGDIVISIDTAKKHSKIHKQPLKKELEKLLIHGVLHLIGYDHKKKKEASLMRKKEKELLSLIQPR